MVTRGKVNVSGNCFSVRSISTVTAFKRMIIKLTFSHLFHVNGRQLLLQIVCEIRSDWCGLLHNFCWGLNLNTGFLIAGSPFIRGIKVFLLWAFSCLLFFVWVILTIYRVTFAVNAWEIWKFRSVFSNVWNLDMIVI